MIYQPGMKNGSPSDFHVRLLAAVLQLIGAGTVWYDLTHATKEYGEGPSWQKLRAYIKSVFVKPQPTQAGMAWVEGVDTVAAIGKVTVQLDPQRPLETRMADLESFAQRLDSELGSLQALTVQQKLELTAEIKERTGELRRGVERVESQLKRALIGNFSILNFGVIWLMVGIILASFPAEITGIGMNAREYFSF